MGVSGQVIDGVVMSMLLQERFALTRCSVLLVVLLGHCALPTAAVEPPVDAQRLSAASISGAQIGDTVGPLLFKDIRFLPRSLDDFVSPLEPVPKRWFVLVFTNTTCPLVQRYLPRLKELNAIYRDQGVQFVAINVGAEDSILDMAAQAVNFDVPFAFVKDSDGSCAVACGVQRTPEVVILDSEYRLRYRGRIDDQYRMGGAAPVARRHALRDAIDDLLAGREVQQPTTPVDGCLITLPRAVQADPSLVYADVAPIIEQHCRRCHQPKTAAPFSLLTHADVAAHAEMIAEVVADRRMPPWYAAEEFGEFENCSAMPRRDRERLLAWIAAGAPRGTWHEARDDDAQAAEKSAGGDRSADPWANRKWIMGKPDRVIDAVGTFTIPASGYVDYKYTLIPFLAWDDVWYEAVEILPDNPAVVHHCNLGYLPLGGNVHSAKLVTGYVPGGGPAVLGDGVAGVIPRGSVLGMQIHFTTTGKEETCRLRVGLRFPRKPVRQQLRYLQLENNHFSIPPFEPFHPVSASKSIDRDITAYGLFAHMHVRGRDITFRAFPPVGNPKTMLMVPNYDFDWQLPYYLPRGREKYPAGTRFECLAHFDNSIFNPYNPDPAATVRVGQQTTQEMMYGFVFYTEDGEQLNLQIDPTTGHPRR